MTAFSLDFFNNICYYNFRKSICGVTSYSGDFPGTGADALCLIALCQAFATLMNGGENFFVAISTINQVSGDVEGIDVIDVTHAISGRIERDGRAPRMGPGSTPVTSISSISIADFLDIVNETHRSILSD